MAFFKIKKLNIFEFIFIFFVILVSIAWIIQENKNIQKKIFTKLITIIEKEWSIDIKVEYYKINFFTGKVFLKSGSLGSSLSDQKNFSWAFDRLILRFSRFDIIFKKILKIDLNFENIRAKSTLCNGIPTIKEHLEKIIVQDSSINVKINSLNIKNIIFEIIDTKKPIIFYLPGNLGIKIISNKYWTGFLNLNNSAIFYNKQILVKNIKTSFIFSQNYIGNRPELVLTGAFDSAYLADTKKYKINFKNNILNINSDNFDLGVDFLSKDKINIFGNIQFNDIIQINKLFDLKINYEKFLTGNIKFNLFYDSKSVFGDFNLFDFDSYFGKTDFSGDIVYDLSDGDKKIHLKNTSNIKIFSNLILSPRSLSLDFDLTKNRLNINAQNNIDKLNLDLVISPTVYIENFSYFKNNKNFIICAIKNYEDKLLYGNINFSLLKGFLPINYKKFILGKFNSLNFIINQNDLNLPTGQISLNNGKVSLKNIYNPIESLNSNFLLKNNFKELILSDFNINFLKGTICCKLGSIEFDDYFEIKNLNIPINFTNFLFNFNRSFYTLFDADLNLTKDNKRNFYVVGKINLSKSYLNSVALNFDLKTIVNRELNYFDNNNKLIDFDIDILTKTPLKVKGGLFDLNVDANLKFKAGYDNIGLIDPILVGSLDVKDGSLNFLDKKLYIDYGKIQFIPNNFNDPIINLVAKNKINKYLVNLQATGYLSNPKIILESFPKMNKKQILGLLLSGSNDINLQSQFSFLLQKNLSSIASNNQSDNFLKKLLNPFKYVQITPNFINHPGKNGFNGCIDVDLGEQLHAKIQKDFNLQDDLSVQLDYFLTDEINLRLLKDQRDELGAEVEVRVTL